MDFEKITALIREFENSSLTRLSLESDDVKIKMSKSAASPGISSAAAANAAKAVETPVPAAILPEAIDGPITIIPQVKNELAPGEIVRSPIVGTFYNSAAPSRPPFVKLGDAVSVGDVLCIVEAMKVMNEITSKASGKIAEIYVENEKMVEYNQPLFRIV